MEKALNQGGSMKQEVSAQTVHAVPAVVGAVVAGLTLNEWVAIITGAYVLVQFAYLIWKWRREARTKEHGR